MTTAPATRPISSKPLRVAGILFIVAGVSYAAGQATIQAMASIQRDPPDTFGALILLVPELVAVGISALAFGLAYVALYALQPRGTFHWLFLLAAVGHLIDLARNFIPLGGPIGIAIALLGTLGAAIYVAIRRLFTPIPSAIFLVTAIFATVPIFLPLITLLNAPVEDLLLYGVDVLYVASGVAMIIGARARTRSTATE